MKKIPVYRKIAGFSLFFFFLLPYNGFPQQEGEKLRSSLAEIEREEARYPEDARIKYNKGNIYYRIGRFEEAAQAYKEAASLAEDETLREKALYNLGNALYEAKKLEESVVAYNNSLQINKEDQQARENKEFVEEQLKKQQEQEQAQQNQKKSEEKQNSQEEQSQKQEEQGDGEQPEQQQDESQTPEEEQGEIAQGKNETPSGSEGEEKEFDPSEIDNQEQEKSAGEERSNAERSMANGEEGEMNEREIEMWLNSLKEDTGDFLKRQMGRQGQERRPAKDW